MKPQTLIGKQVDITDKESIYFGHWGIVKQWDGDTYHIGGGSISSTANGSCPIFDRKQFKVRRKHNGIDGRSR